jgi:hypothetical protein
MANGLQRQATKGPVFIVGAPRSGTTLLQYRLRRHPNISLPTGESHFVVPLCDNEKSFGDLSKRDNVRAVLNAMYKQSAEFLDTDLHGVRFDIEKLTDEFCSEGRTTMPSLISGVFEKNARGEGKARWGDKTPYYVLHIPKLLEWFTGAQIIHIIRDGRDVALSLLGRKDDFGVYNFYMAAKYWQQYVDVGQRDGGKLANDRYLEITFEDLLEDEVSTYERVCDFLGEPFDESMLKVKPSRDPGKTPLVHGPINQANKEKWRLRMTPWQTRLFESVAGGTLSRVGYRLHAKSVTLPLPLRGAYRWHNLLVRWFRKQTLAKR